MSENASSLPPAKRAKCIRSGSDVPRVVYHVRPRIEREANERLVKAHLSKCKKPYSGQTREPLVRDANDLCAYLTSWQADRTKWHQVIVTLRFIDLDEDDPIEEMMKFGIEKLSGIGGLEIVHPRDARSTFTHELALSFREQLDTLAPHLWKLNLCMWGVDDLLCEFPSELKESLHQFRLACLDVPQRLSDIQLCVTSMSKLEYLELECKTAVSDENGGVTLPPVLPLDEVVLAACLRRLRLLIVDGFAVDLTSSLLHDSNGDNKWGGIESLPELRMMSIGDLHSAAAVPARWCNDDDSGTWPRLRYLSLGGEKPNTALQLPLTFEHSLYRRCVEGKLTMNHWLVRHAFDVFKRSQPIDIVQVVANARATVDAKRQKGVEGARARACEECKKASRNAVMFNVQCGACKFAEKAWELAAPVYGRPTHAPTDECKCCRTRLEADEQLYGTIRELFYRMHTAPPSGDINDFRIRSAITDYLNSPTRHWCDFVMWASE